KRRSRSPGLRRAGDGITGWSVAMSLGETTVEFRQAPTVEVEAGFEKTPQQLSRFRLFAKARETRADDGVIMRPDGAVMVAHRIVAGCMRREGTNAPAAKHIVAHQSGDHLSGFFLWDNAGPEALAGIRCHDITGFFGAIERQVKSVFLFPPEMAQEICLERGCRLLPAFSLFQPVQASGEIAHGLIRGEGVALHFTEGLGRGGDLSIATGDGIPGIFPSLVGQPLLRSFVVFDE